MKDTIKLFSEWRRYQVKPGTVYGYERELKAFCLFLRNPEVEEITTSDVAGYLNGLRELGWDRNSFIPKCMALRKFFEFCELQGLKVLDYSLIPIPRKVMKLPRVATEEAYRKLLAVIPRNRDSRHIRNRAIICMLWDSGARSGEIVSLNVQDADLKRMRAVIKTEKSRGTRPFREIFWTEETNENLKAWIRKREELARRMTLGEADALFVSISSGGMRDASGCRFTGDGVTEMLRRYSNRAGLPVVNPHSFRHKLAHDVIKNNGSAVDVMNLLGHASLQSSSIYMVMGDKEAEKRYRELTPEHPFPGER